MRRKITVLLSLGFLFGSVIARGEAAVARAPQASWRTYVTILGVSEDTTLEVMLPHEKTARVFEAGQGMELPLAAVKTDAFPLVVQMIKDGQNIKACEISVEQLTSFDRRYVCTAQGIPQAQVQVRVYTNLHGGERFRPSQTLAKK